MKWSASLVLVAVMLVCGAFAALYLQGRQTAVMDEPSHEFRYALSHVPLPEAPSPGMEPVEKEAPALTGVVDDARVTGESPLAGSAGHDGVEERAEPPVAAMPPDVLAALDQVDVLTAEALPLLPEPEHPAEAEQSVEKAETDTRPAAVQVRKTPPKPEVITGVVAPGDTAMNILYPFMGKDLANRFLRVSGSSHSLANLRAGQAFEVTKGRDGSVELFAYEIDKQRRLVIEKGPRGLTSRVEPIEYETQLLLVRGTITTSLFQAFTAVGESPNLTMMLADVFASEINFIKDLRQGDTFVMLVEKRYRNGEFKQYGRLLGARYINKGKVFEAFRYGTGEGSERFYTGKGESVQKVLLQSPLSVTRVTSSYSLNRNHPVYFDQRPHEGVDYGAPTGTPVKAVGDAQVVKAGWGSGFGNMVVLRHTGSLESMYSHLSGFAKGLKVGDKVKQGQIIGYVGSTGVATGPHLDFRLKQNGKYVNPTKAVNPRAEALAARRLRDFEAYSSRVRACLDGRRELSTLSAGTSR